MRFASGTAGTAEGIPAELLDQARWGLRSASRGWPRLLGLAGLLLLGLVVLVAAWLVWRPRPEAPLSERLQGTWTMRAVNGAPPPGGAGRMIITAEQMTMEAGGIKIAGPYRTDLDKE